MVSSPLYHACMHLPIINASIDFCAYSVCFCAAHSRFLHTRNPTEPICASARLSVQASVTFDCPACKGDFCTNAENIPNSTNLLFTIKILQKIWIIFLFLYFHIATHWLRGRILMLVMRNFGQTISVQICAFSLLILYLRAS